MIKIIVKYQEQKWTGNEYVNIDRAVIMTFDKLEDITNDNIHSQFEKNVDILDITQIKV